MNLPRILVSNRGFTLLEMLVSVTILAIVFIGIYTVQLSMQRSANVQEEYVDIEQNLRIGMDSIARDIRFAGYLVAGGNAAFSTADPSTFAIQAFSEPGSSARIVANVNLTTSGTQTLNLEDPHPFKSGDYVRIIRPRDLGLPIERVLEVDTTTSSSVNVLNVDEAVEVLNGDMLTVYIDPDNDGDGDPNTFSGSTITDPSTITYTVVSNELVRTSNQANVVAEDISSIGFLYFLDDGTAKTDPGASELDDIIGIEVTLNGETLTAEGVKSRSLTSRILMRNI